MNNIIIGESEVGQFDNGKGVFAARVFKKGEIVIKYSLTPLTEKEFENLLDGEKTFTHEHNGKIYLYSIPERYVNHTSNPNTLPDLKNGCDIAIRDIKKGEEITTDSSKSDI